MQYLLSDSQWVICWLPLWYRRDGGGIMRKDMATGRVKGKEKEL